MGSSLADVRAFPEAVRTDVGFALWVAQQGQRPRQAKVMKGILHAFQKKSKRGIKTPQHDIDLIRDRLRDAEAHYGGQGR